MPQTSFSPRTIVALENAIHDPFATKEILGALTYLWNLQQTGGGGGGTLPPDFADITGEVSVDQLPTVGLAIDQCTNLMTIAVDGETVTFDAAVSDWHEVLLGGSRTLALVNASPHQEITIVLTQGGTGSNLVTWFGGIRWPHGTPPTLSVDVGRSDIYKFKQIAPDTYLGWEVDHDM